MQSEFTLGSMHRKDAERKAEESGDCSNMNIAQQVFAACKKRVLVL